MLNYAHPALKHRIKYRHYFLRIERIKMMLAASWSLPCVVMLIFLAVFSLAVFLNRRQLTSKFKGESKTCLSVGFLTVFFSAIFVMPYGLTLLLYILPYAPLDYWILLIVLLIGGFTMMGFGCQLVIIGIRGRNSEAK